MHDATGHGRKEKSRGRPAKNRRRQAAALQEPKRPMPRIEVRRTKDPATTSRRQTLKSSLRRKGQFCALTLLWNVSNYRSQFRTIPKEFLQVLTIGDKFPDFSVTGRGFHRPRQCLQGLQPGQRQGQVEARLLLAQGLHLCLPHRDRRLRQAQWRFRRPRHGGLWRLDRQRIRPPGLAAEPCRPQEPALRHAGGHQPPPLHGAGHP